MTVDPELPVPPILYGGIERIVDMLVRELCHRGHEIHLFANPESTTETNIVGYPGKHSGSTRDTIKNIRFVAAHLRKYGPFDVVHSFGRLAYLLPILPLRQPKIQSYQRTVSLRSARLGTVLSRGSLIFTSCSAANASPVQDIAGRWIVIHNGVEIKKYQLIDVIANDAPLMFLGRIEPIKGAHTAIKIAQLTGRRLIIAGNHMVTGPHAKYFEHEILPHCDGKQIVFVGPVDDRQKNHLLGTAAGLLFPIEWEEPFGIVMAEALACGTPVIAFRRGAVPEVIKHGRTGFVCDTIDDMISAVARIGEINRLDCRTDAEARFSEVAITDQYEALYRRISRPNQAWGE